MSSSTSCLRRRRRKGRRIWWSFVTTESCISPLITCSSEFSFEKSKSNHAWNESRSSKIFGSRKLSSDHSSGRLFCSGVPVSSSRLHSVTVPVPVIALSSVISRQFMFLRRWPSSITTNFQPSFLSSFESRMTISYEVIITGAFVSLFLRKCCATIARRSSLVPW